MPEDFAFTLCESSSNTCDCVLIVENVKIFAHKKILANASPVFDKMFYGRMASDEVNIPDIDFEVFKQALSYIYFGKTVISSIENAWLLVYVCRKYLVDDLLIYCTSYIKENSSLSNLLINYEYAEHYDQETLMQHLWNDICYFTSGIFWCDYHIKFSTWHRLLNERDLNVSEKKLVKEVSKWAVRECHLRSEVPTTENIWQVLRDCDIINRLHFLHVNAKDFQDFIELFYKHELKALTSVDKVDEVNTLQKLLNEDLKHTLSLPEFHRTFGLVRSRYEMRQPFKICRSFLLHRNDMLTTVVTVNRTVAVFGAAVSTEHEPPITDVAYYKGAYTIEVFQDKDGKLVHLNKINDSFDIYYYDTIAYLNFQPVILEAEVNYVIGVRYLRTKSEDYCSQVVTHYLGDISKGNVSFKFSNEFSGSILQGLVFYPV